MEDSWKNKLYFGDNLDILREHVATKSIDLIYLDPPFNSNATYNVLFQEKSGERSAAQITAFDDNTGKAKTIIIQVKSGHVNRSYIATLNSDRERMTWK